MSLEVSQVTKIYGSQKALDQISFSAKPGRILGFLGPNGAGKSTTMKIICGYLPADSGAVTVLGMDALSHPKKVSPKIGYLPEHNPLYLDMYVGEFLEFAGGMYGLRGRELRNRVEEMLDKTGLRPEQHKKISQLSKGYRQRVGLAKALIHDPDVVILDEPTTGLDPNQLVEIRALIREIAVNRTVILSTHIMQEVEAICQDVVIISQGKIKISDTLASLKSGAVQAELTLETEEELDLTWFEALGAVSFGAKGKREIRIQTTTPAETRKEIMKVIQMKALNLNSLNQQSKGLEQIFREITQGN
ncbi:gliding motility-associated ABC transporter ATP-binding subunit GldA [Algoriphagus namhaensis]